jgi:hypothetical protein
MTSYWSFGRAFVLQLGPATDLAAGRLVRRLEHIASTRSSRFDSLEELLATLKGLMAETLPTDRGQQPRTP